MVKHDGVMTRRRAPGRFRAMDSTTHTPALTGTTSELDADAGTAGATEPGFSAAELAEREWFTIPALAAYLETSPNTLYKWVQKGEFPKYVRLPNNSIRVHRDDLELWLHRRRVA